MHMRPRTRQQLLIGTIFAAGVAAPLCAGAEEKALRLSVSVDVHPKGAAGQRPFKTGEQLAAGDRLALRTVVDRNAYVFLMEEGATGGLTAVVPADAKSGGLPLGAGIQTILPSQGLALEVDSVPGQDSILVLASTRPLTAQEAQSYGRLASTMKERGVAFRDAPAAPPPPPPPHPAKSTERKPPCNGEVQILPISGERGAAVTVARFCFQHGGQIDASRSRPVKP